MSNPFKKPATDNASFLPADYVERRHAGRTALLGACLFMVVMVGVAGAFLVTYRQRNDIRARQDMINAEYDTEAAKIEQLKKLEQQRNLMLDKAEVTAALIEKVPRSILLAELITRMPKDITLVELELKSKRIDPPKPKVDPKKDAAAKVKTLAAKAGAKTGDDKKEPEPQRIMAPKFEHSLMLRGVASVNNDIAEYLGQLQVCPLLQNVELQYIKETTINDMQLRSFEILAQIRPDADAHELATTLPTESAPMGNLPPGKAVEQNDGKSRSATVNGKKED